MPAGGRREGAGRKPGRAKAVERDLYAEAIAGQARFMWRQAKRAAKRTGEDPGPEPPKDDVKAAVQFVVKLLLRCAIKGDSKAAMHLDERLSGRTKQEIEIAGLPNDFVFRCELATRGDASPSGSMALPAGHR